MEANRRAGKKAREVLGDEWENTPFEDKHARRITPTVQKAQPIKCEALQRKKIAEAMNRRL